MADDASSEIKKGARNLVAEGRHVQQLEGSLLVLKHLETGGLAERLGVFGFECGCGRGAGSLDHIRQHAKVLPSSRNVTLLISCGP